MTAALMNQTELFDAIGCFWAEVYAVPAPLQLGNDLFLPCLARSLVREAKNCRDYEAFLPPGLLLIVPCVMLHLMVSLHFPSVIAVITTMEYKLKTQETKYGLNSLMIVVSRGIPEKAGLACWLRRRHQRSSY